MLLVPLVVLAYMALTSRRNRAALRYANLEMVGAASKSSGRVLRRLPALLMLLALCLLVLAIARPQAVVMLPTNTQTIMLAVDISDSMRATDIKPTRIIAAQQAAKAFIADQPKDLRIGIVAIAASAALVQSPTTRREDLVRAIDRFEPQRGTALGSGLVIALATLLPQSGIDVDKFIGGPNTRAPIPSLDSRLAEKVFEPVPPGSFDAGAIVLLSDGSSNIGPDPVKAVELAMQRGVRIFTVGIGTVQGATLTADGVSMRVKLDEESLQKMAKMSLGEYFRASNAGDLKKVYQSIGSRLTLAKPQNTEITALFAALATVLASISAMLSLWWFNRII
jgi:Ca-activated chloride channel homolog